MPYTTYTFADIRSELQRKWDSTPFWTDEEARLALNESLRLWNVMTGQWKKRISFAPTLNSPWVELPSTLVFGARVQWGDYPLGDTSLSALDNGRPNWEAETTAFGGDVPARPSLWAPAGLTRLVIWPADAYGCASLLVDGVASTPVFSGAGAVFLDLGAEELSTILGEALHYALFKEGGERWEDTQKYHKAFIFAAADKNSRLKSSVFYRHYAGLDTQREDVRLRGPKSEVDSLAGGES